MSKRTSIALAVGLALVLLIVWRLMRPRAPEVAAPGGIPSGVASAGPARHAPYPRPRPSRPLQLSSAVAEPGGPAGSGSFEGKVVSSATGRGIEAASVTFAHEGVTTTVRSAADGAFRLAPAAPGIHALVLVTADGHLPFSPAWGHSPVTFVARAGERLRDIQIHLAPAVSYLAVVTDERGAAVEGARIAVLADGETRQSGATDAKGEARFTAPDDALVEARHPAHAIGRARLDLGAQVSHRVVIRLGPKPTAALDEVISGRVLDPAGKPVGDALVRATPHIEERATSDATLLPTLQATTDAEGRFTVSGLDAERYDVDASREGYGPASAESVTSGTIDLVLELARGGRLRGRVTDAATGEPVAAFTVIVDLLVGPLERDPLSRLSVFDAEGRYEIVGIPPGSYAVTVVALGHAPSERVPVAMPDPPADIGPEDFSLGRGGRVTGIVREEGTRRPLEGARISLEGRIGSDASAVPLLATTVTDRAGRFELTGLASGLRSITVVAADHHGRIVSGLPVAEGGDVGPITVDLTPTKNGEEPRLELTGIGAVLATKDEGLRIGEVLPGGGAEAAGLGPGDTILAVDGQPVIDLGFEGSIQRIRGPEGSSVKLTVRKTPSGEVGDLLVQRKRVAK